MEMATQIEENLFLLCLLLANLIDMKTIKCTSNLYHLQNNRSSCIPFHRINQIIEPNMNKELKMELKALFSHKIISKVYFYNLNKRLNSLLH